MCNSEEGPSGSTLFAKNLILPLVEPKELNKLDKILMEQIFLVQRMLLLTLSTLDKISADDILKYFLIFRRK